MAYGASCALGAWVPGVLVHRVHRCLWCTTTAAFGYVLGVRSTLKIPNQTIHRFDRLFRDVVQFLVLVDGNVTAVDGLDEVIEKFDLGSLGNPSKSCEVAVVPPCKAFGDITRTGTGCVYELATQR